MATQLGIIRKVLRPRGFGFIDSDGKSYFFHYSKVIDGSWEELVEGTPVSFDSVHTDKGLQGQKIRRIVVDLPKEADSDASRN